MNLTLVRTECCCGSSTVVTNPFNIHVLFSCAWYGDIWRAVWPEGPLGLMEILTEKQNVWQAARFALKNGRPADISGRGHRASMAWAERPSRRWSTQSSNTITYYSVLVTLASTASPPLQPRPAHPADQLAWLTQLRWWRPRNPTSLGLCGIQMGRRLSRQIHVRAPRQETFYGRASKVASAHWFRYGPKRVRIY